MLPEILHCKEFVNADEIARGLSPFQPETVSFQAGRIMLNRINELLRANNEFGFETTLATRSYVASLKKAKSQGDKIILIYFWIESVELAKARVKERVKKGGHNIPPDIIERRYERGLKNFFAFYKALADRWVVYDNSMSMPIEVAAGEYQVESFVYNAELWNNINQKR